ncbi:MAG: acyl-CoA desaturase [Bacteroidota bacterium]|nr:acyl-CoA desaturase [Bacteroidota bacterium]
MKKQKVHFNAKDNVEFVKELRIRVNKYFKDNNISRYANLSMKVKTTLMILLYFTPLIFLLSYPINSLYTNYLLWILMALGMSGIGLSIMHDANHGAYSKNKLTNKILGYLVNFLGAYHLNWKIQHNVLHHSFTNVHGMDEDLENGVLRLSPNQPHKKIFRFQIFYAPIMYGLMTLYWVVAKDFLDALRYAKQDLLKSQNITLSKALWYISLNKLWYWVLTLILPIIFVSLPWWHIVMGFILMHFITGLILGLIFQPAHVLEETQFVEIDEKGSIENNWAIHQLLTTANFANKSKVFSWLIGCLNFQVEHHLFPNICHIHYPKISNIVKQTALEFNIPYNEHSSYFKAIKSHFSLLYKLGKGEYKFVS